MAEYIEREAAVKAVCDSLPHTCHLDNCERGCEEVSAILNVPAADVRPVVTCAECKWWAKQEASLQGRCELLQMYPTGAWFCANGKREES